MKKKDTDARLKRFLGILGCLSPLLTFCGACFASNRMYPDWWVSVSVTYYSSPMLIILLSAVSVLLLIYRGYDRWDTIVNTTAGICGILVACFPCDVSWMDMSTRVGLFWLPVSVTRLVHYPAAFFMFLMFAINSIFLFSKSADEKKNRVYRICGYMILAALLFATLNILVLHVDWTALISESVILCSGGISWLVKGHAFDRWFHSEE